MRVGIYETVEVSDTQRAQIAKELGQPSASRTDLKAYIWSMGKDWAATLDGGEPEPEPQDDDDLLGSLGADEPDGDDEDLI